MSFYKKQLFHSTKLHHIDFAYQTALEYVCPIICSWLGDLRSWKRLVYALLRPNLGNASLKILFLAKICIDTLNYNSTVQGPSVEAKSQVKVKAKVKKLALYTP
jgi:hypothetical protein